MTTWETTDAWIVVFRANSLRRICEVFDRKEDAEKNRTERIRDYINVTGMGEIKEDMEDHYFKVETTRSTVFKSEK